METTYKVTTFLKNPYLKLVINQNLLKRVVTHTRHPLLSLCVSIQLALLSATSMEEKPLLCPPQLSLLNSEKIRHHKEIDCQCLWVKALIYLIGLNTFLIMLKKRL